MPLSEYYNILKSSLIHTDNHGKARRISFLICALFLTFFSHALRISNNGAFIGENPTRRIAESARALWRTGHFEAPEWRAMLEVAAHKSLNSETAVWQDVAAITPHGKLVPKHSPFSVIFSAPWYATFGEYGFFLSQIFASVACLLLLLQLIFRQTGSSVISITIVLCCYLMMWPELAAITGTFSYDLQLITLLLAGFWLVPVSSLLSGVSFGFAFWIRPSTIIALPFLILAASDYETRRSAILKIGIGCCLSLLGYCLLMWLWFGTFMTTTYHHIPEYLNGHLQISSHPMGGSLSELLQNIPEKLLGREQGILNHFPWLLLLPFIFINHSSRNLRTVSIISAIAVTIIYYCSYQLWKESGLPRLIAPFAILALIPVSAALPSFKYKLLGKNPPGSEHDRKQMRNNMHFR